ncbi:helix-turn-helix domain-containing protein [Bacillus haikouensis]|nr:helix-turn-helix domain-containing protein [Bacillus haikouensis]
MNKVGKQIAQLRKEKKITQMNLADQVGVSFQAISNWERVFE